VVPRRAGSPAGSGAATDQGNPEPVRLNPNQTGSRAIPLGDFVADIERRRVAAGIADLPRNAGKRRSESKKALLKAINDAGGKW